MNDKDIAQIIFNDLIEDTHNRMNSYDHIKDHNEKVTKINDSLFFKSKSSKFKINFIINTQSLDYKIITIIPDKDNKSFVDTNLYYLLNIYDELFSLIIKKEIHIYTGNNSVQIINYDAKTIKDILQNFKNRVFFHPKINYQRFSQIMTEKNIELTADEDALLNKWNANGKQQQIEIANPFFKYVDGLLRSEIILKNL